MKTDKNSEPDEKMEKEYDFSGGTRGKHVRAYRKGHSVRMKSEDGRVEEHRYTLADGAVMLDPDLRRFFPDSDSVNEALRSILPQR